MGELNKNIYRKEDDPYGKIFISPLEKDKKQKEEAPLSLKKTTPTQVFSILTDYFQKLIDLINPNTDAHRSISAFQRSLNDIKSFRKLLATLAGEDCSHSPVFNQQLSQLWHNLLDDCNSLPSKEGSSLTISSKVKFFVAQIQNFPIGAEHTLGYYFLHDVGKKWIPFPCMKLLQELHEEFIEAPSHSTLHNWLLLLDEILLAAAKL